MSSLRNYGDSGAYRSRTGIASNSTFGRTASTGSNFSNYRTNYTGIGSSSLKTSTAKDRSIGNIYTGNFTKKDGDKAEEKASFKYSFNKNSEKERLTPGDISKDDQRTRGRSSNGPSTLDKYTLGSGKIGSERSASVLDKYRGSRESSGKSPRYGGSNSYSESSRSYAGEKKEREQEAASTKGPRFASSRASQEPSPEVAGKTSGQRGRSQLAGKNGQSSNYPEFSTNSTSSPRYNGRHSQVSRNNAERILSDGIGFTRSDKFHNAAAKLQPSPVVNEIADRDKKCHDTDSHSDAAALDTSLPLATNSPKNNQEKLHDRALTDNSKLCDKEESAENEVIIISVVTRGTSPTPPPPLTAYARTKRLEPLPKVVRREVNKSELNKVERCAKEQQVDCVVGEGSSRGRYTPRYNSAATGRAFGVPWVSSYLDKFSSSASASNPGLYSSRSTCNISHNRASMDSPGCSKAMDESSKSSTKSSTTGSSTNLIQYSAHNTQHHNRCNSGSSTLAKEVDRPSAKVDSSQKRRKAGLSDGEERKSNASREEPPRVSGGQDHGQGLAISSSRKESSSKSSDGNSSAHGKSASVSRSGSLKLRHTTSVQSPPSVNGPVGCNSANGDRSNSSSSSSSSNNSNNSSSNINGSNNSSSSSSGGGKGGKSGSGGSSGGSSSSSSSSSSNSSSSSSSTSSSSTSSSNSSSSSSSNSNGKSASSTSSATAATAASMTKIKSVSATTTTALPSSSNGKCASVSAGSSVTSRQASSADARDRKPPVPKSEMVGRNGTMGCAGGMKYVNKDFRKSALNMENGDPSRSQISDRKNQKKYQRSVSVSSQDSQSESNSGSTTMLQQVASSGSLVSLKPTKLASKQKAPPTKANTARKGDVKGPGRDGRKSSSKSPPSSSNGNIARTVSISTSECSFDGSSSDTSISDADDNEPAKAKQDIRKKRTPNAPFQERKGKTSLDSSKTSVLVSSADELSINTDKPPRPPSTLRSRNDKSGKTDEAKSFLIRTLAPVANNFKIKQQESADEISRAGGWVDACSDENSDSAKKSPNSVSKSAAQNLSRSSSTTNMENNSTSDKRRASARVRRQSSGEKPWWLDSNSDNVPEGVERHPSIGNDDISQDTTISTVLPDDGKFKFRVWRQESGERAWWLDASEDGNIPEDEPASGHCSTSPGPARKQQRSSPAGGSRLRHQQSGERAWWMSDDPESVPEGVEVIPVSPVPSPARSFAGRPARVDSGEKPWWLDSSSNVPEGVQRIPTDNSNSDSSESLERVEIGIARGASHCLAKFPLDDEPLGDRASPEGIENPPDPPDSYGGRSSPYDNVTTTRQKPPRRSAPRKRPANLPLFIGNHTNIDDLLGDTTTPGHRHKNNLPNDKDTLSDSSDEECEEIDATQVIIHDSTPQTPVIQRRHRQVNELLLAYTRTMTDHNPMATFRVTKSSSAASDVENMDFLSWAKFGPDLLPTLAKEILKILNLS